MIHIHPFRAVRPEVGREATIASVPYDVVGVEEARHLAQDNPDSFLHVVRPEIDLPPETNPYSSSVYQAGQTALQRLLDSGAMVQDTEPRMYLYGQEWRGHHQVGLVCCCPIDDYEQNRIRKHEKTRRVKEDDRTQHVLTVNANTGPVFLAYRGETSIDSLVSRAITGKPLYQFQAPDGVEHRVWEVSDWQPFQEAFGEIDLAYVADGHHRSASAARAGRERAGNNPAHRGDEEYTRFLVVLFPSHQLCILSYNRLVRDLGPCSPEQFLDQLAAVGTLSKTDNPEPTGPGTFGVYFEGRWHLLTLDPGLVNDQDPVGSLDVSLLQDHILTPILGVGDPRTDDRMEFVGGIRGADHLRQEVDAGRAAAGFTLYPTTIEQLMTVADADLMMPPKSTWFEPKLRSGLLVHMLD